MARTVSDLPGPVASWIMGALAKGQRVYYFTDDPSGYVDSVPAIDRLGRPVMNDAGQQKYRNVTKAETLPLYRITPLSLELPEANNLYIFASVVEPGMTYFVTAQVAEWSDGVSDDSAFYASPTVKYHRVCVTPDNRVIPQERITGFSSGQDKAILAAVAVAAAGYWAFGSGGAAAGGAAAGGATSGGAAAGGAAAGAEFVGPVAPAVAGGGIAGVGKAAVGIAQGAVTVAGAVTQVSAALQGPGSPGSPGSGNTEPPPEPPADNTIYWMVGGAILVIGAIL